MLFVPRSDDQMPVEEEKAYEPEAVPGGSVQTRDYYLDSSSSSRRRRSVDRKSFSFDVSELPTRMAAANARVSPAVVGAGIQIWKLCQPRFTYLMFVIFLRLMKNLELPARLSIKCSSENRAKNKCIDVKVTKEVLPRGGDIVFGVAHQHSGGLGVSLHGQDGRLLCASLPTYGNGEEAGNEENYIVGMSTCYPKPGSIKVTDGEVLTIVSNYSSDHQHTGIMGLVLAFMADQQSLNVEVKDEL
ncbi:hypothetical protein E2562_019603 [Oryza meyeriana var. granulata]|uniref:Uncharacterized protein n=1 Tax=Oryza meyeriana var. granulata TaxID=110450 RepID=A0A6G1EXF2_9ORYZ|nr:hypothetical protein E2562_019603 [Oryza meyeriana var. granulata]